MLPPTFFFEHLSVKLSVGKCLEEKSNAFHHIEGGTIMQWQIQNGTYVVLGILSLTESAARRRCPVCAEPGLIPGTGI